MRLRPIAHPAKFCFLYCN